MMTENSIKNAQEKFAVLKTRLDFMNKRFLNDQKMKTDKFRVASRNKNVTLVNLK